MCRHSSLPTLQLHPTSARTKGENDNVNYTNGTVSEFVQAGGVRFEDRYSMLNKIRRPTLIVHGQKDIVVNPINAFLLEQHLPDAQLLMYPDASRARTRNTGTCSLTVQDSL